MTSEMIHKVMYALRSSQGLGDFPKWEKMAIAAIEAMREPTEPMIDAAASEWVEDWRSCRETIPNLWKAAIDAALKGNNSE